MKKLTAGLLMVLLASGCTHKIEVAAKEPITINMNLKIDHEVRVKVDQQLDKIFEQDDSLF